MKPVWLYRVLGTIFLLTCSSGCSLIPATSENSQPNTPIIPTAVVSTAIASTYIPQPHPTEASTPMPLVSPLEVGLQDNQGSLALHPGERFLLNLGEGYDWSVQIEDPAIIERVQGITVVRGAQGIYEALTVGETKLQASGEPTCRAVQPPCMMPSLLFEITIQVQ